MVSVSHLTAKDIAAFAQLGIPEELLALAKVERVTDAEAREKFGILFDGDVSGIVFPYRIAGRHVTARLRRDNPERDVKGRPENKYISAFNDRRHLYVLPGYEARLDDPQTVFVYVEAEKSVLAVEAWAQRMKFFRPILPFGCGGCWGWKGEIGIRTTANGGREPYKGPLPEVSWARDGRAVAIIFDSNSRSNPRVRQARKAFQEQLEKQGAKVSVFDLPAIEGVNGVDDFISASGDSAFLDLFEGKSSKEVQDRPVVAIHDGEMPLSTDAAEKVLLDHALDLKIFERGTEVVRIVTLPEARKEGALALPTGTVVIEALTRIALQETFERLIRFVKFDVNGKPYAVNCPARVAESYLRRTGSRRLPVLTGVISAPLLLGDGSILQQTGYHSDSGLYFISSEEWQDVPEAPTFEDAKEALRILSLPFSQFPFRSDADKAVHLAGVLTGLQRHMLRTAPLFAYKAPERRTGKSLLVQSLALLSTGHAAPSMAASGSDEEFRKAIFAALYRGNSVVNLDNLEKPLKSPFLCIALTEEVYSDRILGESRMVQLPTKTLWCCTGNNLELAGDLTARSLLCSIDANDEHPEERVFDIPDLRQFLLEHRPELVRAALTILKAFHIAGMPKQDVPAWGGFEEWSRLIRECLVWLGLPDPAKTREAISTLDPDREYAAALLQALREAFQDDAFTMKRAIKLSNASSDSSLREALMNVASRKGEIDSKMLGWWCRHWRDRVVNGLQLRSDGQEHRATKWKIKEF